MDMAEFLGPYLTTVSRSRGAASKRNLKKKLYKKCRGVCSYCGSSRKIEDLTIDHTIPISGGGTWNQSNLTLMCRPCNANKANRVL